MDHGKTRLLRALTAACLLAAPAAASEVYDTGDPYDGQEISHSPSRILIRFTEPVRMEQAHLEDEAGRVIDVRFGRPEDDAGIAAVTVRIPEVLPPGKYRLHWAAYVPGHRHSDDGTVRFTVLTAPPPGQAAR